MKLLVIRHGPAGDPDEWKTSGRDDRLRPLTPEGKKEMRRAAAGIATLVPHVDILATSPLVRAAQTAEIVAEKIDGQMVTIEALEPDRNAEEILPWLKEQRSDYTVGLVGHEPHLSTVVGYLLAAKRQSFVDLKKGGACLLALRTPKPGEGNLEWLLTRRQLERLGE